MFSCDLLIPDSGYRPRLFPWCTLFSERDDGGDDGDVVLVVLCRVLALNLHPRLLDILVVADVGGGGDGGDGDVCLVVLCGVLNDGGDDDDDASFRTVLGAYRNPQLYLLPHTILVAEVRLLPDALALFSYLQIHKHHRQDK